MEPIAYNATRGQCRPQGAARSVLTMLREKHRAVVGQTGRPQDTPSPYPLPQRGEEKRGNTQLLADVDGSIIPYATRGQCRPQGCRPQDPAIKQILFIVVFHTTYFLYQVYTRKPRASARGFLYAQPAMRCN